MYYDLEFDNEVILEISCDDSATYFESYFGLDDLLGDDWNYSIPVTWAKFRSDKFESNGYSQNPSLEIEDYYDPYNNEYDITVEYDGEYVGG
mmetsp:Transcript_25202/g.11991  ORF Transcript_25202/g.11991 Transcript_25202/m.11991 type:complete len:92 (+) Transcript_25202:1710-1985(+)